MSVAEICDEIREAPFYDDHAAITRQQLASAYERLLEVSRELVGWIEGTDGGGKGGEGMSMTSEGLRLPSSQATPSAFHDALQGSGLRALSGCGVAAVRLMQEMRAGVVLRPLKDKRGRVTSPRFSLGALVRHGLARFTGTEYELTRAGLEWLAEVEPMLEKGGAKS